MNYIPDKPKASEILKYANTNGMGIEYTNKALKAIWCENSIVELDKALREVEHSLDDLTHHMEDIAKSSNDALNEGFWLGVLFGLFIGGSPVFEKGDH